MSKIKCKEQSSRDRIRNFEEVSFGYTEEEAVAEASRCLNCGNMPCVNGCPVEIEIPRFIQFIKERNFKDGIKVLKEKNNLPAICGRVCPQEDQCEKPCIMGKRDEPISIGKLERFLADWEITHKRELKFDNITHHKQGKKSPDAKVAIIGSGPAGLTCAAELAKKGYEVSIFESLHAPGGVLTYGIPEFRLPKKIVNIEIDYIRSLGVEIFVNIIVGKTLTIEELRKQGYKAFFIATGAGLPYFPGIEGENLNGVYSANEFLTRANLMKSYLFPEYKTPIKVGRKTAVIGAGNVAFDAARCARRLGLGEVTIVYRRTRNEMPAREEEIVHAEEEGIRFQLLTSPVRIIGDENGWVKSIVCLRNKLGEPDESGRRRPVPVQGSEFTVDVDTVICAIGQGPNPLLLRTIDGLKLTGKGNIDADHVTGKTSIPDIFAGGDIVTGAATVIEAMGAGKKVAVSIDTYLKNSI